MIELLILGCLAAALCSRSVDADPQPDQDKKPDKRASKDQKTRLHEGLPDWEAPPGRWAGFEPYEPKVPSALASFYEGSSSSMGFGAKRATKTTLPSLLQGDLVKGPGLVTWKERVGYDFPVLDPLALQDSARFTGPVKPAAIESLDKECAMIRSYGGSAIGTTLDFVSSARCTDYIRQQVALRESHGASPAALATFVDHSLHGYSGHG